MIELTLPYPPSVNGYWRHVPMGRAVRSLISERGRQYRRDVATHCLLQGRPSAGTERLAVHVEAFPPDRRQRDLDNILKGLLDALTHAGVWGDDSQIDRLVVERGAVERGGRVLVRIARAGA